jgi:hypothetical protein
MRFPLLQFKLDFQPFVFKLQIQQPRLVRGLLPMDDYGRNLPYRVSHKQYAEVRG